MSTYLKQTLIACGKDVWKFPQSLDNCVNLERFTTKPTVVRVLEQVENNMTCICLLFNSFTFSVGYYSVDGSAVYVCPAGTYSNIGATACTPCSINTYSNAGESICTDCGDGPCPNFIGSAALVTEDCILCDSNPPGTTFVCFHFIFCNHLPLNRCYMIFFSVN